MTVPSQPLMMRPQQLGELFVELQRRGHRLMGPRLRDGAIVYADLDAATELPIGWTDRQEAGHYRVHKRDDEARFGYVVGPHSWKQIGLPMRRRLWRAERDDAGGFAVQADEAPDEKLALIGVRACELAAFDVQDKVLRDGPFRDTFYSARRANMFIVSVNCTEPGGTCFCTSMDTGPRCRSGYDINLTELPAHASGHVLIATAGTDVGREVLAALQLAPADAAVVHDADAAVTAAAGKMGRELKTVGLQDLLYRNLESPHWDDVASRCLSCTNCTLVCPTCFCTTVEDTTDLTGQVAERHRRLDSCFSLDHSEVHGGHVRQSTRSRYRQWMTHKLATWLDQFGTSGCVGCGRCITWCPVGIDITAEVQAIRESEERAT